jgi:hypothetical protein
VDLTRRTLLVRGSATAVAIVALRVGIHWRAERDGSEQGERAELDLDAHGADTVQLPLRAANAGALPAAGRPDVAGIRLPAGAPGRMPGATWWITDDPVDDWAPMCDRLAARFPRTGLWPAIRGAGNHPLESLRKPPDPATIARLEQLGPIVSGAWGPEPPLAPATFRGRPPRFSPFERLQRARLAFGLTKHPAYVVLIPARRPADIVARAGLYVDLWPGATPTDASLLLRSWEDRFGAVVVELGTGEVVVAVAEPATDAVTIAALWAEQGAASPHMYENELHTAWGARCWWLGGASAHRAPTCQRPGRRSPTLEP